MSVSDISARSPVPHDSASFPPARARIDIRSPLILLAVAATSVFMGWNVARGSLLAVVPLALGILALFIALRPDVLFVGWLLAAPFIQETARDSQVGLALTSVFYALPPLVLAMHTVRSNSLARHVRWYDALPAAYLGLILVSQGFVDSSQLAAFGFYTGLLHASVFVGVIMYYVCAFGPLSRLSAHDLAAAVLLSVSLVAVLGIVQHYTAWTLWGAQLVDDPPRIVVTLSNPALLGAFLGAGIVTAVAVLALGGPRSLRRPAIATLVLALPALFFTYTRAGIVATVLVAAVLALVRQRTRLPAVAVAFVAATVFFASWGTLTQSSLYQERASDQENVSGRLIQARAALDLVSEKPIFGVGYGQYDTAKSTLETSSGNLSEHSLYGYTSHNTFLTIIAELGILGIVVFLLPWAIVVFETIRTIGAPSVFPPWFTASLLAVLAIIGLTALTTDMRFASFVPALAWIVVGLLRRRLWDRTAHA